MKSLVRLLVFAVVSFVLGFYCTPSGFAQAKSAGGKTTVTGCLQKGDEAGEFSLTSEDGKTWGLRSSSVKLDPHVGHKVTVRGLVTRESKAEEKKEGQLENASGKEEYGELRVTSLKMVSPTCSK